MERIERKSDATRNVILTLSWTLVGPDFATISLSCRRFLVPPPLRTSVFKNGVGQGVKLEPKYLLSLS